MPKKMLIDATHPEETRVVVVDGNKVEDFDFESASKRQLAGNIYLAKITRVEPSLQAAFVEYGGNRHGFLAFAEIHPDYYQIPIADRQALLAEERALAEALDDEPEPEEEQPSDEGGDRRRDGRRSARRGRGRARPLGRDGDAVATREAGAEPAGMETIDLGEDGDDAAVEGLSPMARVAEAPVDTPEADDDGAVEIVDKDDTIETIAADDDALDMRTARKPRARRYKIQEVVKVRQIMLIQVVKEERGNKGAALTTYLSLAGRYCVLMPNTARGGGISRKITNAVDRKKLKEIAGEMDVPDGAGLIIRTAGSQRTRTEIKRDYEYLQRLWEQIRELTLKSIAPAKIYEEGDLIKRSIRDLFSSEIDEVIVEGAEGYRTARDFMTMILPANARNVIAYTDPQPLFARHQVESYLASMFNPTVQLPSGGYIVIGVTEALVAIDVNSGRATKEGSIEQTALKTNLEAADEVARQLRLRDLAGLIVIDFIDMDERRNNASVEKRFKDKLKDDRARIQVGRISGFGLLEMSRQRLRPGMIEASTQPCSHCHGTGLLRSDDSVSLAILRSLDEEGVRGRSKEVLVRAPVNIMNFLMNHKREHIAGIEQRYSMAVRIEGDTSLVSPDFAVEKFKTAIRAVPEALNIVKAGTASLMQDEEPEAEIVEAPELDEPEVEIAEAEATSATSPATELASEDDRPRKKRRRRRRRRNGEREDQAAVGGEAGDEEGGDDEGDDEGDDAGTDDALIEAVPEPVAPEVVAEPPRRTRTRTRKPVEDAPEVIPAPEPVAAVEADAAPEIVAVEEPKAPRPRTRARKAVAEPVEAAPLVPARAPRTRRAKVVAPVESVVAASEPAAIEPEAPTPVETTPVEPVLETVAPAPEADTAPAADKPKRRGWWSSGR